MSLTSCTLSWQAFLACTSHAFSTSKQEIMGLLLGSWDSEIDRCNVTVEHLMVLTRTDKKPDRCEVSVEQLAAASTVAEEMSHRLKKTIRVCGWYHSHPAITVLPSHVDVRTQMQYQLMHNGFVGLIFAVFQLDSARVGKIEVTAFQSTRNNISFQDESTPSISEWVGKDIPLAISPPNNGSSVPIADALSVVTELQNILFDEEKASYLAALEQYIGTDKTEKAQNELLEKLYCSAVYSKSLVCLMAESMLPLQQSLLAQLQNLQKKGEILSNEIRSLRHELTSEQEKKVSDMLRNQSCSVSARGCLSSD